MKKAMSSKAYAAFPGIDFGKSADYGVPELMLFLKSAFRQEDFSRIEKLLKLRDERREAAERRLKELERKVEGEYVKSFEVLEKEMDASRARCGELAKRNARAEEEVRVLRAELELRKKMEGVDKEGCMVVEAKLGEMEFRMLAVKTELGEYKRRCSDLEDKVACLEEDKRAVCWKEQRAREKIALLMEELKKNEQEINVKFVEFKVEIRDLECSKRRAENDILNYKKQCEELETRVLTLEAENSNLRGEEKQNRIVNGSVFHRTQGEEMEAGVLKLGDDNLNLCDRERQWRDKSESRGMGKVFYGGCQNGVDARKEGLKNPISVDVLSACHPPVGETLCHVQASTATNVPCEPCGTSENMVNSMVVEEEWRNQVRKKVIFQEERSSDKALFKSSGDVVIIDSDDELGTPPLSKNFGRRSEAESEKKASRFEDSIPSSILKRKHALNILTSDGEGEDSDDDKVPISKLRRMKGLSDLNGVRLKPSYTPVKCSNEFLATLSGKDNAKISPTPLKRCKIPRQEYVEARYHGKKSLKSHSQQTLYPKVDNLSPPTPEVSVQDNLHEDEVEKIESDNEGQSFGGFLAQCSYGSDCENASEDEVEHSELNELLESIRRKKVTSKWEYEADMLSAFGKDPELCMKAVCALYHQQISNEKSFKGSLYASNRGFNQFDALKGSALAEFLTHGDRQGPLKKTVEELQKHDPKGLEYCRQLASRYSNQLFDIYQKQEDPHFFPHS